MIKNKKGASVKVIIMLALTLLIIWLFYYLVFIKGGLSNVG